MNISLKRSLAIGLVSLVVGSLAFAQRSDATFIMDNNCAEAWLVLDASGAEDVTEFRVDNPTINLEVGKRYTFDFSLVNNLFHPFDMRDGSGAILLDQGIGRGMFEDDEAVAFQADEDSFSFTLTPELAAVIFTYHCTIHATMVGSVVVSGSQTKRRCLSVRERLESLTTRAAFFNPGFSATESGCRRPRYLVATRLRTVPSPDTTRAAPPQ